MECPKLFKKKKCRRNDDYDFQKEIYDRYDRLVVFILRKYVYEDQAIEDLAQTVFLKLYHVKEKLRTYSDDHVRACIEVTAEHVAFDYNKRRGIERNLFTSESNNDDPETPLLQIPDPHLSVEENAIRDELIEYCRKELKKLPEHERWLLVHKYFLKTSSKELAELEHCDPASIRMKMTRARRVAKELFDEKGGKDLL